MMTEGTKKPLFHNEGMIHDKRKPSSAQMSCAIAICVQSKENFQLSKARAI